jgi:hypothetical protein
MDKNVLIPQTTCDMPEKRGALQPRFDQIRSKKLASDEQRNAWTSVS